MQRNCLFMGVNLCASTTLYHARLVPNLNSQFAHLPIYKYSGGVSTECRREVKNCLSPNFCEKFDQKHAMRDLRLRLRSRGTIEKQFPQLIQKTFKSEPAEPEARLGRTLNVFCKVFYHSDDSGESFRDIVL